jgi:hypothetical protein
VAGPNPWGAATLEWSTSSPPPAYNFLVIPVVRSRMPLWAGDRVSAGDVALAPAAGGGRQVRGYSEAVAGFAAEPGEVGIHLPSPSAWPIVVAFGIAATFGSLIFLHVDTWMHSLWYLSVASPLVIIGGVYAWAFEPGQVDPASPHPGR